MMMLMMMMMLFMNRLSDPYGGRSVPATTLPRNGEMNAK